MDHRSRAPSQCLDKLQLDRLLREELGDAAESSAVRHISSCQACQREFERIVGLRSDWNDAKLLSAQHDIEPFRTLDNEPFSLLRHGTFEVDSLQELMGPTDDPNMMGRLGSYEVCGLVGHGSTGIVLKAHEPSLNRFVAIKVLAPTFARNRSARARFEREGKSVAAIRDQHVVPIHAVNEYRGVPYIVMQYVAGGSLDQRIQERGPLEAREVMQLGMQIARGLAAAHAVGIVHRDIKPANVLLERNVDRAIVSDFGLAQVADEAAMTRSGVIAGTPQYMSPEQAKGETIDPRSDLFSLGSVLYTACTGHAPFRSETVFGVIKKVCEANPHSIRDINPTIPPWLESLITKLHHKDRHQRFTSAHQVASILENELAYLNSPAFVSKPKRNWLEPSRQRKWRNRGLITAGAMLLFFTASLGLPPSSRDNQKVRSKPVASINAGFESTQDQRIGRSNKRGLGHTNKGDSGQFISLKQKLPNGGIDGFTVYLPDRYDATSRDYPVHICTSGNDAFQTPKSPAPKSNEASGLIATRLQVDRDKLVKVNANDPMILIIPSYTNRSSGNHLDTDSNAISEILNVVMSSYRVDKSRIFLMQSSQSMHNLYELIRHD